MSSNFKRCLELTLAWEGGYVHDPRDPGGATCYGITLATYQRWAEDPSLGCDDVRDIPRETVAAIYSTNYWNAVRCNALPRGIDLMVFDQSVNGGCGRSVRILQGALGIRRSGIDGCVGPNTLGRVATCERAALIHALAARQLAHYHALPGFATFGHGWTNRVHQRRAAALGMLEYATA